MFIQLSQMQSVFLVSNFVYPWPFSWPFCVSLCFFYSFLTIEILDCTLLSSFFLSVSNPSKQWTDKLISELRKSYQDTDDVYAVCNMAKGKPLPVSVNAALFRPVFVPPREESSGRARGAGFFPEHRLVIRSKIKVTRY